MNKKLFATFFVIVVIMAIFSLPNVLGCEEESTTTPHPPTMTPQPKDKPHHEEETCPECPKNTGKFNWEAFLIWLFGKDGYDYAAAYGTSLCLIEHPELNLIEDIINKITFHVFLSKHTPEEWSVWDSSCHTPVLMVDEKITNPVNGETEKVKLYGVNDSLLGSRLYAQPCKAGVTEADMESSRISKIYEYSVDTPPYGLDGIFWWWEVIADARK